MKLSVFLLAPFLCAFAQSSSPRDKVAIDSYSSAELASRTSTLAAKHTSFASQDLDRYGNHYTMLAFRSETGSAEIHRQEADIFFIHSGTGYLLEGGTLVSPKTTKPGELRGTSLSGATRLSFGPGAVLHIPAGTPHQMLVDKGHPVSYFVVKVTGQ